MRTTAVEWMAAWNKTHDTSGSVLGALEEGREIRHRIALPIRISSITCRRGSNATSNAASVPLPAGNRYSDHGGLGLELLGRRLAQRMSGMPHAERGAHNRRHVGDMRGAGIHQHGQFLARRDQRCRRNRIRRSAQPARTSTLSCVSSSCTTILAVAPLASLASRLMSLIVYGFMSSAWVLR